MSIKSDLKSVADDFSSIIAGFKLALIVISYFGLGTVAKWVISHWYPFTRWVWDYICKYLTLPILPDVIKDSLTALVFFLPLAVTSAIGYRTREDSKTNIKHRFLGAFFGVLFLMLICKDVFSAIAISISNSTPITQPDSWFVLLVLEAVEKLNAIPKSFWIFVLAAYLITAIITGILISKNLTSREYAELTIRRASRMIFTAFASSSLVSSLLAVTLVNTNILYQTESEILVSITIMSIILSIIAAAVAFAPRKLFITAGVCIGFVFLAMCVELILLAVQFIERAPAA